MGPWMKARELKEFTEAMDPRNDNVRETMEKIARAMLIASSNGFHKISYHYDGETLSEKDIMKIRRALRSDGYDIYCNGPNCELEISW